MTSTLVLTSAKFFSHRRVTIVTQLLPFLILALAEQPALSQANIIPVRPPGADWVHVRSWCAGPAPRPTYCPPGERGQHWSWVRPAGRRGANDSIAYYEQQITFPSWKPRPNRPPWVWAVNCATWESRMLQWQSVAGDKEWEPINPRSYGDTSAQIACKQAR